MLLVLQRGRGHRAWNRGQTAVAVEKYKAALALSLRIRSLAESPGMSAFADLYVVRCHLDLAEALLASGHGQLAFEHGVMAARVVNNSDVEALRQPSWKDRQVYCALQELVTGGRVVASVEQTTLLSEIVGGRAR